MSTPVETLAIMLQRAKTFMEVNGLSGVRPDPPNLDGIYRSLSSDIYELERRTGVNAPALRDAEDEAAEPRSELPGTPLCQCTDPECPHCGGECDLLPMYHLVRLDRDRLDDHRNAQKVQMCEHCGEDALESGPFALDHTVGCSD